MFNVQSWELFIQGDFTVYPGHIQKQLNISENMQVICIFLVDLNKENNY